MRIKKWLALGLLTLTFLLSACGNEASSGAGNTASTPAGNAQEKTYTVGTNAEFAPFESQMADGELTGFDIDLMKALAEAGGFKITFKNQPWDSLFASLSNRDFDIIASAVTITDERKQTMAFSDPYFEIAQVVLVPQGKQIKSAEDLKKLERIGVVTGNTGDLAAQKILGATSPKIARFESLPLLIKEVESGGVDVAISDSAVISNYIKNNGDKGFTSVLVSDFEVERYGLAVRPDDTELLNKLNTSLQAIRDNGEYDKIYQKYFAN
ncbi:basic amino acid ABC transporter substrate-binding protein [Stenoxybacter acetivorans]|uniref:basic amino acid ABC transporter substrate-binding protein n=1 Tax=Stenoxybacter acetivorans TaxID=422441 RepID=UPI000566B307|nr:basic amino acid ABC transporter substrate-binding protein [Stenoxybacter acetivorans]